MAGSQRLSTVDQGRHWERLAESFLRRRGLNVVDRNFRSRLGEIDLIANDGRQLVFVEVRFRRENRHGSGAETVGPRKQRRIVNAAAQYLASHRRLATRICRFDVISISGDEQRPQVNWIRNAFQSTQGQSHA